MRVAQHIGEIDEGRREHVESIGRASCGQGSPSQVFGFAIAAICGEGVHPQGGQLCLPYHVVRRDRRTHTFRRGACLVVAAESVQNLGQPQLGGDQIGMAPDVTEEISVLPEFSYRQPWIAGEHLDRGESLGGSGRLE